MKALVFNGAMERKPQSTPVLLSTYLSNKLQELGIENNIFNLADAGIPLFDTVVTKIPLSVELMNQQFLEADVHFWLAPLYHGSIPGAMKNCLDWLELSSKAPQPYLTDKNIGMICWADGIQAMQGINTMDAIAKALRAWPVPFSAPLVRSTLFDAKNPTEITAANKEKLNLLVNLATSRKVELREIHAPVAG
ncbi:NADPH-dependent FMN reductase [Maribellus maritimus]|uniref:NADPH-dependent FMN reductase n=1 Tax=Maribellus maritimus TaxID=2870838 RepID=UPI001EEC74E3|nr:NAD(P)H-dependent oxidoreductase [Maribellus maritimus]MCG6189489.1 NAD(P)H-dependent oxidoreductase [Maribellus maritimus]